MFERNCDNCRKQDNKKLIQDCNTFGYPLFEECGNWEDKEYLNIPDGLPDEGLPIK